MSKNEAKQYANLKIGDLARLTGVSVHTLRIWERRYGSPRALRTKSGHRRYTWAEVARLRAVSVALSNGYRAGQVAGSSLEELRVMIEDKDQHLSKSVIELPPNVATPEDQVILETWMDAMHQFHEGDLHQSFQTEWARKGMLSFIECLAVPFIKRLGEGWVNGEITIAEEHFCSGKLSDFLSQIWRHQSDRNNGPAAVLATPTDEDHELGLTMAAVVLSFAGYRIIYLGVNTPWEDILEVSQRCRSSLIALSISLEYPRDEAQKFLTRLRRGLSSEKAVVTGGLGYSGNVEGILSINSFQALFEYALKKNKREVSS